MGPIWSVAGWAVGGTGIIATAIFVLLARVSGYRVVWMRSRKHHLTAPVLGDLLRDALGALAVIGAVRTGVYGYRNQ